MECAFGIGAHYAAPFCARLALAGAAFASLVVLVRIPILLWCCLHACLIVIQGIYKALKAYVWLCDASSEALQTFVLDPLCTLYNATAWYHYLLAALFLLSALPFIANKLADLHQWQRSAPANGGDPTHASSRQEQDSHAPVRWSRKLVRWSRKLARWWRKLDGPIQRLGWLYCLASPIARTVWAWIASLCSAWVLAAAASPLEPWFWKTIPFQLLAVSTAMTALAARSALVPSVGVALSSVLAFEGCHWVDAGQELWAGRTGWAQVVTKIGRQTYE
jgi:hypothetical protein